MLSPVRSVGGDMVWRQTTVVASTPPGQHYTTLNHRRTDLRVTVHKALGWCVESKKLVRLNAFPAATRCHCQEPCLTHDTHTEHRRTTGRYAVDCVAHPCWLQTGRNRIGPDVPTVRQNRPSCRRRWSCCRCHRCPTASSSACGALPCRLPTPPHCCQPPTKPALCTHTHTHAPQVLRDGCLERVKVGQLARLVTTTRNVQRMPPADAWHTRSVTDGGCSVATSFFSTLVPNTPLGGPL